jgi:hypothetical protein
MDKVVALLPRLDDVLVDMWVRNRHGVGMKGWATLWQDEIQMLLEKIEATQGRTINARGSLSSGSWLVHVFRPGRSIGDL